MEDFAECFAHYLHITDTIDTAREGGLVLHKDRVRFAWPRDIVPCESYADAPVEKLLFDWTWISLFFNRVNTAMGKNPLYPFEITEPVAVKLGFVHTWSGSQRSRSSARISSVCSPRRGATDLGAQGVP